MNRYDQMNWGQLQLPSLQEMALVPSIKRQQHDSALANLEKYRSDLLKIDPHRKYQEEALRLQNEMNFELDNVAEQLNKQGFTSSTTSDVLRLNRRINELMAPTGKVGQINAHKKALNEAYKNYLEESIKAGNSPEIAKYHAEKALYKHLNEDPLYDEQGNVVPFNIDAAPTYVDFNKFVMDAAKEAKLSEEYWSKAISYLTKDDENNRYVLNEKAKGLNANNYKALQAVRDYVNNTLADPSSPLRRSVDYNLRDLENLKVLGQNATSIFETSKTGITDSSSTKTSVDWAERETEEPGVYSHSSETMPWSSDIQEAKNQVQNVLNDPNATPSDIKDARQKQEVLNEIDNLPEVQKLMQQREKIISRMGDLPEDIKEALRTKDVNSINDIYRLSEAGKGSRGRLTNEQVDNIKKYISEYKNNTEQILKIKNEAISRRGTEQTSFLTPMKESDRKNYNSNLKIAMTSDNVKATDITLTDSDGNKFKLKDKFDVLADNDARKVLDMLRSVPNEKIQAIPAQRGSQIGMEVTFIPNDGEYVDPKGWGFNGNKVKFDGNKPVTMFIPITKNIDGRTGLDESSQFAFSILPKNMQREIRNKIYTADLSTTSDTTQLGKSKVPASRYLKGFNNEKLDFSYMNYDGTMNKKPNVKQGHVPNIIDDKGNSRSLQWSDVVDLNKIGDPAYIKLLEQSGAMSLIQQQYQNSKGAYNSLEEILTKSPVILPDTDQFSIISLLYNNKD